MSDPAMHQNKLLHFRYYYLKLSSHFNLIHIILFSYENEEIFGTFSIFNKQKSCDVPGIVVTIF